MEYTTATIRKTIIELATLTDIEIYKREECQLFPSMNYSKYN